MWMYSINPVQVIWLADNQKLAWHLNLFSMTRVKEVTNIYIKEVTFTTLSWFSTNLIMFFLIFPRKQDLTFLANCLYWRQFVWNDNLYGNFFLFIFIWVLQPFHEFFTYIEPIIHQRWAKTGEPPVSRTWLSYMWPEHGLNHSGEKSNKST